MLSYSHIRIVEYKVVKTDKPNRKTIQTTKSEREVHESVRKPKLTQNLHNFQRCLCRRRRRSCSRRRYDDDV